MTGVQTCALPILFILFTGFFVILIKPNVRAYYDYCNILFHNIFIYLISNDLMCNILIVSS